MPRRLRAPNTANVYIACDYRSLEIAGLPRRGSSASRAARAQINLGDAPWRSAARRFHQRHRALEIARFVGDTGRAAVTRAWLCGLHAAIGQYDVAKELGKDALQSALQTGSRRAVLYAHQHLGDAYRRSGMHREALYHYHQAQSTARDQHVAYYEALLLERCASVERRLGSPERAAALCGTALEMADRIGAQEVEAVAQICLAHCALALGRLPEAEQSGQRALAVATSIQTPDLQWQAHAVLGRVALERRQLEEASTHTAAAVAAIEALRQELRRADLEDTLLEEADREQVYLDRARVLEAAGHSSDARAFLEGAEWPPLLRRFADAGERAPG